MAPLNGCTWTAVYFSTHGVWQGEWWIPLLLTLWHAVCWRCFPGPTTVQATNHLNAANFASCTPSTQTKSSCTRARSFHFFLTGAFSQCLWTSYALTQMHLPGPFLQSVSFLAVNCWPHGCAQKPRARWL